MAKIYVPITDEEFVGLSRAAFRDNRHPREQARYFIRQALSLVADGEPSDTDKKHAVESMIKLTLAWNDNQYRSGAFDGLYMKGECRHGGNYDEGILGGNTGLVAANK